MKEYIYGQGKRPSSDIKNADIVLEEAYNIADELGFKPVLWHGTCLGFYRDGTYTYTDNDLDIAISGSDKERDIYFKKLLDSDFERGFGENHFIKNKIMLDVYTYDGESEDIKYKAKFYNIPSPIEEHLKEVFGNDWRTPKHSVGGGTMLTAAEELPVGTYLITSEKFQGQARVSIKHQSLSGGTPHACLKCGKTFIANETRRCPKCGWAICPFCGGCYCKISVEAQKAVNSVLSGNDAFFLISNSYLLVCIDDGVLVKMVKEAEVETDEPIFLKE